MKTSHALIIGVSTLLFSVAVSSGQDNTGAANTTNAPATATAASIASVPVPLASSFNSVGIYKDGDKISDGVDGNGFACSAELLGASQAWEGVTFKLGSPGASNVVTAAGQTIPLPAGTFSSLHLLMIGVNGNQEGNNFLVTYADNTVQTNTQSISDWFSTASYPTEAQVVSMDYRNESDGSKDESTCYVFGYFFKLNPTKTVKSVTLPDNSNVKIFAMTLVP